MIRLCSKIRDDAKAKDAAKAGGAPDNCLLPQESSQVKYWARRVARPAHATRLQAS
jgi:hypothetical protein